MAKGKKRQKTALLRRDFVITISLHGASYPEYERVFEAAADAVHDPKVHGKADPWMFGRGAMPNRWEMALLDIRNTMIETLRGQR